MLIGKKRKETPASAAELASVTINSKNKQMKKTKLNKKMMMINEAVTTFQGLR